VLLSSHGRITKVLEVVAVHTVLLALLDGDTELHEISGDVLSLARLTHEVLKGTSEVLIAGGSEEGPRVARLAGAAGAADAVDVVLDGEGEGVVDDVLDVGDIEAAGRP
jgi:hypothetical protein